MLRPGLTAIVIVAMLAWAGHSLARLFWLFIPLQVSEQAGTVLPSTSTATRRSGQLDSVDIAFLQENFRLGGSTDDAASGTVLNDSALTTSTRLSLVLRGAVAGSDPAGSSAIIASGDQQRVYFIGDELEFTTPGVTLDSVHANYVVLNNNGRRESLWMYEAQDQSQTTPTSALTGVTAAQRVNTLSPDASSTAQREARVQIRLYRDNGTVRGVQIREDSDAALLSAAGLQVGDVVTAIDGVAITGSNELSALNAQLQGRDQVSLDLIRNGATMTLAVNRDAFAF
ncbi:MAG: type II secretion system protein N [Pseudohongiella sp.]